jgi:hypothetical protein
MEAVEIARVLAAHPNTVYSDLHAFDRDGLASLRPPGVAANSCGLKPEQVRDLCRLAEQPPYELGLPWGGGRSRSCATTCSESASAPT